MNFDIFKRFLLIITLAFICGAISGNAIAEDFVVVVNKKIDVKSDSISKDVLKRIFLGQTDKIFGQKIKPIGLKNDIDFANNILGMSSSDLKEYWIKEGLKGGGRPPRAMSSTGSLIIYVKKKSGAIGYLTKKDAEKSGLKMLKIEY